MRLDPPARFTSTLTLRVSPALRSALDEYARGHPSLGRSNSIRRLLLLGLQAEGLRPRHTPDETCRYGASCRPLPPPKGRKGP